MFGNTIDIRGGSNICTTTHTHTPQVRWPHTVSNRIDQDALPAELLSAFNKEGRKGQTNIVNNIVKRTKTGEMAMNLQNSYIQEPSQS
jgi:hypothetical protein